jgi:3-phosphoglycerate kinase
MNKKLSIKDIDCYNKRVLVRVDFNVPLENQKITDDTRIVAAIPTIKLLKEKGAKTVLVSHLGRPKGKSSKEFSLAPAAQHLSALLGEEVMLISEDEQNYREFPNAQSEISKMKIGETVLLENIRFYPEEEQYEKYDVLDGEKKKNVDVFLCGLAALGDIYLSDAFGTAHRAHSSTVGVAKRFVERGCGLLLEKEIEYLGGLLDSPARPFIAILGGAKVSDKIGVIKNLLPKVDGVLVGGAMAYTFLKAQGLEVGKSLVESEYLGVAANILEQAKSENIEIVLPEDHVLVSNFNNQEADLISAEITSDMLGVDIGPNSIERFTKIIHEAKTIVWNGPMGVFEKSNFAKGTFAIAKALGESEATTVVGGGDSVAAINKGGFSSSVSHISTGGGASLEFLEGISLPGIEVLTDVS